MSTTAGATPAPDRDARPDLRRRDRLRPPLHPRARRAARPEFGGNWRTTSFGSALDDWQSFTRTLLNGLTAAGLLFIVASGFSLIFGLMRVVNMAHGSFYLLGGYIAYEVQQEMTGQGFSLVGSEVSTWEWILPGPRRGRGHRRRRPRRAAGLPALEPGPGAASGADHDRDLGDPRRPGDRALQRRYRRQPDLARAGPTVSSSSRSSGSSTRSHGSSCSSSALPWARPSGPGSTARARAW